MKLRMLEANQPEAKQARQEHWPRDPDLFDMSPDEVWAELHAQRARWRGPIEVEVDHFKVNLRGGMWTAEHKGVAVDSTRSVAQSHLAQCFCSIFSQHKSASFSHAMNTEHFA